jgi:hypothetical protein
VRKRRGKVDEARQTNEIYFQLLSTGSSSSSCVSLC